LRLNIREWRGPEGAGISGVKMLKNHGWMLAAALYKVNNNNNNNNRKKKKNLRLGL
jgi:hypothetical protein